MFTCSKFGGSNFREIKDVGVRLFESRMFCFSKFRKSELQIFGFSNYLIFDCRLIDLLSFEDSKCWFSNFQFFICRIVSVLMFGFSSSRCSRCQIIDIQLWDFKLSDIRMSTFQNHSVRCSGFRMSECSKCNVNLEVFEIRVYIFNISNLDWSIVLIVEFRFCQKMMVRMSSVCSFWMFDSRISRISILQMFECSMIELLNS